jgi:hypothetical protein
MKVSEYMQGQTVEARVVKPLYGHTDANTAYVVDDYPYGRHRTQKRFWLESKPKKGWRFVGQTLNPKTQRWNKPKASTYTSLAACMYLDEKEHVQWDGVSEYSDADDVLAFVKTFPKADMTVLKKWIPAKIKYLEKSLSGEVVMTINKKPVEVSDADRERWTKELKTWQEASKYVK